MSLYTTQFQGPVMMADTGAPDPPVVLTIQDYMRVIRPAEAEKYTIFYL